MRMDKSKLLELALVEWIANLKSRDRSRKNVRPNFEELCNKWKNLGGSFDDLYETLLPKAIKAHQPLASVARSTFKALKSKMDKTEKEFVDEWNSAIEGTGQEVFFEFFPATTLDQDDEPKVYGNMSATEYNAQRRHADNYPILSTDELIKKWKEQQEYNLDVEDTLENVLGINDETNS